MKQCTKCNVKKDEKEFYKEKRGKDGLMAKCKQCMSEYSKTQKAKETRAAYAKTPEAREARIARDKTPEYKKVAAAHKQTPEYKEKEATRRKSLEYKAQEAARNKTPEYKEVAKAHRQLPDVRLRRAERTAAYKNSTKGKEASAAYSKTPEGKLSHSTCINKRERELGFKPINKAFKGSHGHHLLYNEKYAKDPNTVIYIPVELHKPGHGRTHPSNQREVNIKASRFLMQYGVTEAERSKGAILYTAYCLMPTPTWFKEQYSNVLNAKK